jgi:hypothetical protein
MGDTILFWHDLWNRQVLKLSFPQLHSYAKSDKGTISSILQMENFQEHFHLPLSEIAYEQLCEVICSCKVFQLRVRMMCGHIFGGMVNILVSKAYNHFIGHDYVHLAFKWIWKSCYHMKQKMFFCLLLQNRLNTRGMMRRRNMVLDSYTCELCLLQRVETLRHLFLLCPFAKNCWASIEVLVPSWLRAQRATTYM